MKVIGVEDGYTVIEMLTVMVILSVVMGGIIAIFVSGLNADADSTRRYQDQQDARRNADTGQSRAVRLGDQALQGRQLGRVVAEIDVAAEAQLAVGLVAELSPQLD